MRRVWTALRMLQSPPVPAMLNRPRPSMKNGRFSEKNIGKPLVHLHLERVALDLAEIGIDGRIDAVTCEVMPYLPLRPDFGLSATRPTCPAPSRACADRPCRAREQFEQAPRREVVEHQLRVTVEDPLARRHVGP